MRGVLYGGGRVLWVLPLMFAPFISPAAAQSERRVTQLAEKVYLIEHADRGDGYASGNTTVIIGDRQVFVVDAGYLPSAALEDITQIRRWTDKPVSFLLNTHFHNDHNLGNSTYLDQFPGVTIVGHTETRHDMDILGPGMQAIMERSNARIQRAIDNGKLDNGRVLSADELTQYRNALALRGPATMADIRSARFQPPTMLFDHDFSIDIGNRVVEIKFLGRGNTAGDAVVYLPKEKIVIAGDLVVHPVPFIYDGYPSEWWRTLDRLAQLDVTTIVPGHGPAQRDMTYVRLLRDTMKSAVEQIAMATRQVGPAMFRSVEEIRPLVDLSSFRPRFVGSDTTLAASFDDMTRNLINVAFKERSLR